MPFDYLRSEAKTGRMGSRLMAIVAEGTQGRVYLTPTPEHEAVAEEAEPKWTPDTNLPERALGFRVQEYGMTKWRDLFTPRQLVALTTFSDLVAEAMERVKDDMLGSRARCPRSKGRQHNRRRAVQPIPLLILWPSPAQGRQTRPKVIQLIKHGDFASRHFLQ